MLGSTDSILALCLIQSTWLITLKSLSHVWLFATPWTIQSMEFSRPETGVGSLSLLQGIFPTQGLNSGLLHCRHILYPLSHKGSPREPRGKIDNWVLQWIMDSPGGSVVTNLPANAGNETDTSSISGWGRSPGIGNGNPLQYSCLENFMNWRSLECCSPWGCKELDTIERLSMQSES